MANIETWYSPFRTEKGHGILLRATQLKLREAAEQVRNYWSSFLKFGVAEILMKAELTQKPVFFEWYDMRRGRVRYLVRSKGVQIDRLTQPTDCLLFVKPELDEGTDPSTLSIATYRGQNQRFTRLVALVVQDDTGDIPQTSFQLMGDKLVQLDQITRPQVLFPTHQKPLAPQFLSIESLSTFSNHDDLLNVRAGIEDGSREDLHIYRNLGSDLVITQKLRVTDLVTGEMELFDVENDGTIRVSPFSLPQAVTNIANFEPATASY